MIFYMVKKLSRFADSKFPKV